MKIHFSANRISFGTLARLLGGEIRPGKPGDFAASEICTDSREADANTVFVALRGEKTDGHQFIPAALENGCRCVICERSNEELERSDATAIVVKDTELALSVLANSYKHQYLHCETVAVTGSVGKTTTKDMISAVLSTRRQVYKTPGNHNSLIGMPLSVAEIPTSAQTAVLEMGMSNFGEIERLSIAAEPDIAVITNIGTSHMEMLGSRENICRAKLEILCGLRTGGTLLLNGDEPLLAGIGGKSYHTVYVSTKRENCDYYANNIRVTPDSTVFDATWGGKTVKDLKLRVVGRHNVYAALYAIAVGTISGLNEQEIREGLLHFEPEGMRQNIYRVGKTTVIEDCYNASPESMLAALDVLAEYSRSTGHRSIAVLGDMLELGTDSPAFHRNVGAHLAENKIGRLFTVGGYGNQIAVGARQHGMSASCIQTNNPDPDNVSETGDALLRELSDGDVILVKASRAVRAERIISYLKERI